MVTISDTTIVHNKTFLIFISFCFSQIIKRSLANVTICHMFQFHLFSRVYTENAQMLHSRARKYCLIQLIRKHPIEGSYSTSSTLSLIVSITFTSPWTQIKSCNSLTNSLAFIYFHILNFIDITP